MPKVGSLRDSTSACLKIGKIWAIRKKKIGKFLKNEGCTLRYLLTDLLLKQTKLAPVQLRPIVTKNADKEFAADSDVLRAGLLS